MSVCVAWWRVDKVLLPKNIQTTPEKNRRVPGPSEKNSNGLGVIP